MQGLHIPPGKPGTGSNFLPSPSSPPGTPIRACDRPHLIFRRRP